MKIRRTLLLFIICIFSVLIPAELAAQWVRAQGIDTYVNSFATSGNSIYAGTIHGVYQSTDNGANWTAKGLTDFDIISIVISGNNIIAGSYNGSKTGINISENNGADWTLVNNAGVSALAVNGNYVFAGSDANVLRSSDNGKTWTTLDIGLKSPYFVCALAANGSNIVAGVYGNADNPIYYSSDNGASWQSNVSGFKGTYPKWLLTYANTDVYAGTWWNGVFRSTDNGQSWTNISKGTVTEGTLVYSIAVSDNLIFIGAENKGAFETVNNGAKWGNINTGIPNSGTLCTPAALTISGSNLVGGISVSNYTPEGHSIMGVWIRPLAELTTSVNDKPVADKPGRFSLAQNYPNPFNPSTTISFSIPEARVVTIKVFDQLGKEVSTVLNEYKEAGTHTAQFNASSLPSGIYVYTIQAGEFRDSKKLLLLK